MIQETLLWQAPENSIYFMLFFVAVAVLMYRFNRTNSLITILGKTVNGKRFLHHVWMPGILLKNILWALGLLFLFITLLHPCWNKKEETILQ